MEDLEYDGWLGNEPDDAPPLAATAEKRIDFVNAPDAREAALGKAAPEKALDRFRDDPPERTEGLFEVLFVFSGEAVEALVKDGVEGDRSGRLVR